jgi:uncharacterized protein (TIGR00255 family)
MLKSMTGFGKAECSLPSKKLTIEIKSLNSKQIDTSTRLPAIYKSKDLQVRKLLAEKLERGKIECSFHYEFIEGATVQINAALVKEYFLQLSQISDELGIESKDHLLASIMRLPDTVTSEKAELDEDEWGTVIEALKNCLDDIDKFRIQEGQSLEKDLKERCISISEKLVAVEQFEKERISKLKERIFSNLEEVKSKEDIDQNRFEQEIIYYLEKLDISEEKVRLKNHCDFFLEVLEKGSPNGKKLGFISQEMGREINTLGSKANHIDIQRLVVEMKDALEKIKEQVLNVL